MHKIPVIGAERTIGSAEVEANLPDLLKEYKVVMIRGHGSFATGQLLEEAYQWTSALESVARIIYLTRTMPGVLKEDKQKRQRNW